MTCVLDVENLCFGYEESRPVLRNITFSVREGECLSIVGSNGAGKSTLLWCLLGLLPASGVVRFFGEKMDKSRRARVGVVFQNPEDQLFMPNVLEDVALALRNRGDPAEVATARALSALDAVGLRPAVARPASQLSLGERKRAAIAAAMAGSPAILLLDEPTAELDGRAVRQLSGLLSGLTIARVITSHHLDFLRSVSSRTLILSEGSIRAEGETASLLADVAWLERAGLL